MAWRRITNNPPLDGTPVIVAAVAHGMGTLVGEARFLGYEGRGDWWWASDTPGECAAEPLAGRGHVPEWWQPMPEAPNAETD